MTDETARDALEPRLAELVRRFEAIGAAEFRDLPLYNPKLAVEALGFQRRDEGWLGALITPWFINIVLLPAERAAVDWNQVGRAVMVALPSGPCKFVRGGDEVIGHYLAQSVQSPVLDIPAQGAARQKARQALAALLEPASRREEDDGVTREAGPTALSRRDLFRGRRVEAG